MCYFYFIFFQEKIIFWKTNLVTVTITVTVNVSVTVTVNVTVPVNINYFNFFKWNQLHNREGKCDGKVDSNVQGTGNLYGNGDVHANGKGNI